MNVHVFETIAEAEAAGAKSQGAGWWLDAARVVTPRMIRALDGMRVHEIRVSPRAAAHPEFRKLHEVLRRSQAKTKPESKP